MDDMTVPSLSTGIVGSRFVSQDEIDAARARRDQQWKAAYARLGQEPPPQPVEDSFDGRSLAEKLAANRAAKQEEWEEKTKLANQFRALEEDEVMFLDSLRERQQEEERQRKLEDGKEVKNFKEAVAARSAASNPPTAISQPLRSITSPPVNPVTAVIKKDGKKSLKGVVVKKRTKPITLTSTSPSGSVPKDDEKDETNIPQPKRRKVSGT